MANINVNTTELQQLLDITPADHNIMLVGKHGIGKSEILTEYYSRRGMKVVPLFLGQMSDPGDLIGIPNKNEETGKTEFMPPYWFPLDGKPIVLFLDELNRARPEILQTIMDLALNRTLAGRALPEGSWLPFANVVTACQKCRAVLGSTVHTRQDFYGAQTVPQTRASSTGVVTETT